jgi:hypothetical protein
MDAWCRYLVAALALEDGGGSVLCDQPTAPDSRLWRAVRATVERTLNSTRDSLATSTAMREPALSAVGLLPLVHSEEQHADAVCQVCGRSGHPARRSVTLHGPPVESEGVWSERLAATGHVRVSGWWDHLPVGNLQQYACTLQAGWYCCQRLHILSRFLHFKFHACLLLSALLREHLHASRAGGWRVESPADRQRRLNEQSDTLQDAYRASRHKWRHRESADGETIDPAVEVALTEVRSDLLARYAPFLSLDCTPRGLLGAAPPERERAKKAPTPSKQGADAVLREMATGRLVAARRKRGVTGGAGSSGGGAAPSDGIALWDSEGDGRGRGGSDVAGGAGLPPQRAAEAPDASWLLQPPDWKRDVAPLFDRWAPGEREAGGGGGGVLDSTRGSLLLAPGTLSITMGPHHTPTAGVYHDGPTPHPCGWCRSTMGPRHTPLWLVWITMGPLRLLSPPPLPPPHPSREQHGLAQRRQRPGGIPRTAAGDGSHRVRQRGGFLVAFAGGCGRRLVGCHATAPADVADSSGHCVVRVGRQALPASAATRVRWARG